MKAHCFITIGIYESVDSTINYTFGHPEWTFNEIIEFGCGETRYFESYVEAKKLFDSIDKEFIEKHFAKDLIADVELLLDVENDVENIDDEDQSDRQFILYAHRLETKTIGGNDFDEEEYKKQLDARIRKSMGLEARK